MTRLVSGTLVVAVTAGAALLVSGTANGATPPPNLGSLTINPGTGTDISTMSAQTSAACPSTAAAADLKIIGPIGAASPTFLPSSPFTMTTNSSSQFSTTGPYTQQFRLTLKDAAADSTNASTNKTLQPGEYDLTSECIDRFSTTAFGTFTGKIFLTSGSSVSGASFSYTAQAPTTTTLTAAPASTVTQGSSVTLTAAVSPSAAGTVQFLDGTSTIGAAVVVTNGSASTTTTTLSAAGSPHSLTAVFTPTDTMAFGGSTSNTVNFTVNAPPSAPPTTTTLSVTPSGTVASGASITLNAGVTPTTAAGTVQFTDNGTNLGSAVAVSGGTASTTTTTLAAGTHSLVASFIPADPTAFATSSSSAVSLTVSAAPPPPGSSTATETITTTITAGSLVISVANTNVTLPSPTLNPAGTLLTTTGKINPVTVTDTRAGNPGWSVSGQVADFSDGASHAINGGNLGWVPNVIDKGTGQAVTAGSTVAPANGIAPGATPPAGSGLNTSRTLATAAALGGVGHRASGRPAQPQRTHLHTGGHPHRNPDPDRYLRAAVSGNRCSHRLPLTTGKETP